MTFSLIRAWWHARRGAEDRDAPASASTPIATISIDSDGRRIETPPARAEMEAKLHALHEDHMERRRRGEEP